MVNSLIGKTCLAIVSILASVCVAAKLEKTDLSSKIEPILINNATSFPSVSGVLAENLCKGLVATFKPPNGLTINNTFSYYYPEGSMPSLELLTQMYPTGTIPPSVKVPEILDSVGPDVDIKSDAGYGKSDTRAAKNGPLGGLPPFCRFGAYVKTSDLTIVLSEVWMPLASDLSLPLAPINSSDFPTNTTSFLMEKDGKFLRMPLYAEKGQVVKYEAAPGSHTPLAPNDLIKVKDSTGEKESIKQPPTESKSKEQFPLDTIPIDLEGDQVKQAPSFLAPSDLSKRKHKPKKYRRGDDVLGKGDGWNGRLLLMGNGGQRGFVPFPDMKQIMSRYRFAVAGTNLGHFATSGGVTWVNGSQFDETILDWASRGNHVTLQLAEAVIDAFYGPENGVRVAKENNRIRRYYTGSSVGGARGLSAVQVYPEDFHGVLLGPPAQNFINMNIGQIHLSSAHNTTIVGNDGFFTRGALYGPIQQTVLDQCDQNDGVNDGIIADPWSCKPDFASALLCGGNGRFSGSNATCLTEKQLASLEILYQDAQLDGHFVYPRYLPGLESSAASLKATEKKASGWTQLAVLKYPALNKSFNPFTDISFDQIQTGNLADPGKANAAQTDLSEFVNFGGKMILYHGGADMVISPMATIQYFEEAVKVTKPKDGSPASDSLKFFFVPGMQHSRGGPGAWHFGGVTQTEAGNRPLKYDTKHDMLLALVSWTEGGHAPQEQVAARYEIRQAILPERLAADSDPKTDLPIPTMSQNYNWGVTDTRLLCPWPQVPRYNKEASPRGANGYKAFNCS